uniref:Putative membrane protein YuiD isoform X2 n=1 Tax=Rhizophora mucronata TaxID=61149 RepID=A0A2P2JLS4_RHIMU
MTKVGKCCYTSVALIPIMGYFMDLILCVTENVIQGRNRTPLMGMNLKTSRDLIPGNKLSLLETV